MDDQRSEARASDNECVHLLEAGPEMTLELSARDWDALMEVMANPSQPNAVMLRSINRLRQHMVGEPNDVDKGLGDENPALEVPG